jgi:deazaflavin-dependent oxidoreductase (nitroreductase family)
VPLLRNRLANPFVRALARTPAYRLLGQHLVVLRYTGRRSGRSYELPVMSSPAGEDLVVVSGQHDEKTWWRNFGADPRTVTVRRSGHLERRSARRLPPADAGYAEAVRAYRRQFPHVRIDADTPVLVLARSSSSAPEPPEE